MYYHIMVSLDGSKLAECVIPHLEAIAGGCQVSKVTLVRVVEPFHLRGGLESGLSPEERQHVEDDNLKISRDYLEQIASQLKGIVVESVVLHGHIAEELVDYAHNNGVDLIIIASHGRSGISRWVFGSIVERILHSSCVPVLMVRAPGCVPGI